MTAGAAPISEGDSVGLACLSLRNEARSLVAEYKNANQARRQQILTRLQQIGRQWNAASCGARYGDVTGSGPTPKPEPCLNILTCRTEPRLPGRVDPGPPRRQADLPTPSAVVNVVEAVQRQASQYVRLDIEVTNWKAYHETLFWSGRQYPACGEAGNRFRTRVDILTADRCPSDLASEDLLHRDRAIPSRVRRRLLGHPGWGGPEGRGHGHPVHQRPRRNHGLESVAPPPDE